MFLHSLVMLAVQAHWLITRVYLVFLIVTSHGLRFLVLIATLFAELALLIDTFNINWDANWREHHAILCVKEILCIQRAALSILVVISRNFTIAFNSFLDDQRWFIYFNLLLDDLGFLSPVVSLPLGLCRVQAIWIEPIQIWLKIIYKRATTGRILFWLVNQKSFASLKLQVLIEIKLLTNIARSIALLDSGILRLWVVLMLLTAFFLFVVWLIREDPCLVATITRGAKLHLVKLVRYEPWLLSAIMFDLLDRSETLITNASSSTLDEYALEIQEQYLQRVYHDQNCVVGHICKAHSDKYVAKCDSHPCINHIAEEK